MREKESTLETKGKPKRQMDGNEERERDTES